MRPELTEIVGKQELYSSFYAVDYNRPEPKKYPHEAIPEEDVALLQQLSIGMYPEQIGNREEVAGRLKDLRESGVDFPPDAGGLTPCQRSFIYHFQEGVRTTDELAEKLNKSRASIRGFRAQVEKTLGTPYQPDRTFTPREQEFLDHYNAGITRIADLAVAMNTGEGNIKVLGTYLRRKGLEIDFQRKVELPTSILQFADALYSQMKQREKSMEELVEISDYWDAFAAAGGI